VKGQPRTYLEGRGTADLLLAATILLRAWPGGVQCRAVWYRLPTTRHLAPSCVREPLAEISRAVFCMCNGDDERMSSGCVLPAESRCASLHLASITIPFRKSVALSTRSIINRTDLLAFFAISSGFFCVFVIYCSNLSVYSSTNIVKNVNMLDLQKNVIYEKQWAPFHPAVCCILLICPKTISAVRNLFCAYLSKHSTVNAPVWTNRK